MSKQLDTKTIEDALLKVPTEREDFDKYWENLSKKEREEIKEIVIERIKQMPDNLRMSIG
jgi:hypothetical protein